MKKSSPLVFVMSLTSGLVQYLFIDSLAEATTTFNRLTKNESSLQPSNSSLFTTPSAFPDFIRPSVNPTAECNLWGLLCQTGSIEVDVNMTTTITKTTVPCAYYLSAQAESARPGFLARGVNQYMRPDADFLSSFGHSPECSVYADDLKAPHPHNWKRLDDPAAVELEFENYVRTHDDPLKSAFHFSKCGSNGPDGPRAYTPPGVSVTHLGGPFSDFYCCGACTLKVPEIRLLYFPASSTYSCSGDSANKTSRKGLSSGHNPLNKRIHSLLNNGSTLVTNGYTLTSPSFYLEMVGTASMQDSCGRVGSVYTNAIVPVPSDGLSTISLNLSIGASFMNREYWRKEVSPIASYTKQVRLEDLACPTWGLMNAEINGSMVTVGSPFFPIIHPPSEVTAFDHAWSSCTELVTAEMAGGFLPYEIFDPPRILVPVPALGPAINPVNVVTSLDPNPTTETLPKANPVDLVTPELPSITKKPLLSDLGHRSTKDLERTSARNSKPAPMGNSENSDPNHQPEIINSSEEDHDAVDPGSTSESTAGHNRQASLGIGALIFSAFGAPWGPSPSAKSSGGGIIASPTRDIPPGENEHFTFAGHVFTKDPSSILVDGFNLIPNGNGATRSGTVIQLDSGGNLVVDGSTTKIAHFNPTPPPKYTINGQTMEGNPSFLVVGDQTVKPGGAGVTMFGKFLRLNSGGDLMVDTSTLKLAGHLPPLPSSVYTVNGQAFTGGSSFLAVDGKTMTPGGAAVTISGTALRLNSGGDLVVGTSTLKLANLPPSPSSVYTVNGQVLTGGSSFLALDGKTMTAGGAAVTISGTALRLNSGGDLVVGTSTLKLANLPPSPSSVYTVNGQALTGDSSFLAVDGKTMTAGGAAITISGTILRLNSGGELVVNTSTLKLASTLPTPLPSVYTVNGQIFSGDPSLLAMDGKTMTPGGAVLTISGTRISLEPSGVLRFGTEEILLATNTSFRGGDDNMPPATFLGGQERVQATKKSIAWLLVWIAGFCMTWL